MVLLGYSTKTGRYDRAEILLKVALNTINQSIYVYCYVGHNDEYHLVHGTFDQTIDYRHWCDMIVLMIGAPP